MNFIEPLIDFPYRFHGSPFRFAQNYMDPLIDYIDLRRNYKDPLVDFMDPLITLVDGDP